MYHTVECWCNMLTNFQYAHHKQCVKIFYHIANDWCQGNCNTEVLGKKLNDNKRHRQGMASLCIQNKVRNKGC